MQLQQFQMGYLDLELSDGAQEVHQRPGVFIS